MPDFVPVMGTRAQIDTQPLRSGRLLFATDTGEIFLDLPLRRVRMGGSGDPSGDSPGTGDADGQVVNGNLELSPSVRGGGASGGLANAPVVRLESAPDAEDSETIVNPDLANGRGSEG